jgi:serine/threonine protein kinase
MLGRYRILKRLGRGGMGDVWLGEDPRLHRQVAIKTLPTHNQSDREFSLRFEREAQAAAALNHPHILPIHDYGEHPQPNGDVITYIVMPYIAGGSLAEWITAQLAHSSFVPPQDAIAFLSQAAEAIDYAHQQGVIHRDIKPANMLLRSSTERWLLLADFGIARMLSSSEQLTQGGVGIGTPEYMAPEQAQGHAELVSDNYSLAIIAYQLLTGRLPFKADTGYATIIQHITMPPPPPCQVNPTLPLALDQVLMRGLSKQPSERPTSARAFVSEVQAVLNNAPFAITYRTPHPIQGTPYPSYSGVPDPTTQQNIATQRTASTAQGPITPGLSGIATSVNPVSTPGTSVVSRRRLLIGGGAALAVIGGGLGTWAFITRSKGPQTGTTQMGLTPTAPDPNAPAFNLQKHVKPVTALTWSPKKNVLVSVADNDDVMLWDMQQLQQGQNESPNPTAQQNMRSGSSMQLAWSPDGSKLAIANTGKQDAFADNKSIEIYNGDLSNHAPGFASPIITDNAYSIEGLGWLKNNTLVAVAIAPGSGDTTHSQLWAANVAQAQQKTKSMLIPGYLGGNLGVAKGTRLAVSPDGTLVALAFMYGVMVGEVRLIGTTPQWVPHSPELQFNSTFDEAMTVIWSPSGKALISCNSNSVSTLAVWDWQTNKSKKPDATMAISAQVTALAWNPVPKSTIFAAGTADGRILIWNMDKSSVPVGTLTSNINASVMALAWSSDGQWLAASFKDTEASLLIWKIQGRGF